MTIALAFSLVKFLVVPPKVISRADTHRLYALTTDSWSPSASEAYVKIVERESTFRPYCTTSRSSSAGLYGFLRSTRKAYGVTLKTPLTQQSKAFLSYVKRRYGTLERAWRFHKAHGYY